MTSKKGIKHTAPALLVFLAAAAAMSAQGCDDLAEAQGALCCEEGDFQVGGTISADAEYSAEVKVAIQAVADIAGIASATLDEMTVACNAMAEGLDVTAAERDAAAAIEDKAERMEATCQLAVTAIGAFKAKAGVEFELKIEGG
jgi:hypothetical protein